MIDWRSSMQQTFEYYIVDPATWRETDRIQTMVSCEITRDTSQDTLGSATFECTEILGECYIRVYLVAIQNGERARFPLGTFLVQTPSIKFDGKINTVSLDAYTPLYELKEKKVPLGYAILKGSNIMTFASSLTRENVRAPVVRANSGENLNSDFVATLDDDWLAFLSDLVTNAKFAFDLDELSRILFAPQQDVRSLNPVWTYTDDNSSILYPEITMDRDLYGIPNVVEVVYSRGSGYFYARAENNDVNSPVSIPNRGREVVYRETDPSLGGTPTQEYINEYANQLLRNLSALEYRLTYSHGYCPVRQGDCVRLDYARADLRNIKAKVIRQVIKCEPGCPVEETAVFSDELWR